MTDPYRHPGDRGDRTIETKFSAAYGDGGDTESVTLTARIVAPYRDQAATVSVTITPDANRAEVEALIAMMTVHLRYFTEGR